MHPLLPTALVFVVVLAVLATGFLVHAVIGPRSRRDDELSTAWLDLDGSARRHRWSG